MYWKRLCRDVVESPSSEAFNTTLDKHNRDGPGVLGPASVWREGLDDLLRSLPAYIFVIL